MAVDTIVTDATSITWTIKSKNLPAAVKTGTKLTELGGQSRLYAGTSATGGATVPSLDEVVGGAARLHLRQVAPSCVTHVDGVGRRLLGH